VVNVVAISESDVDIAVLVVLVFVLEVLVILVFVAFFLVVLVVAWNARTPCVESRWSFLTIARALPRLR
jgi:hypothetical protein